MTQVVDTSGDSPRVRSNLQVPADADGSLIERNTLVISGFLEGDQQNSIGFVLDERFRERVDAALEELLTRGLGKLFKVGSLKRDRANAITVDLKGDSVQASIILKHDIFRPRLVAQVIDSDFRELV